MQLHTATPWHRASYDRLMQERLPIKPGTQRADKGTLTLQVI